MLASDVLKLIFSKISEKKQLYRETSRQRELILDDRERPNLDVKIQPFRGGMKARLDFKTLSCKMPYQKPSR